MKQFDTLAKLLDFMHNLEECGMPIPPELYEQKARLEERERIDENEFIFSTMKAHNKFMSEEKEACVREMVDELLVEGPGATDPCLLLGNVQCGKTDTFESIMGLSMDRGIDVCVVLTKNSNTLAEQTKERLRNDFKYFAENGTTSQKIIVRIFDIMDLIHEELGTLAEDPRNRFIIVCKKETKNLQHLTTLFTEKSPELARRELLIVDDEADFASRAYYQRAGEFELLKISDLIEQFRKIPRYHRYLQVTATPYSLYLQPDGSIQLRAGKEASPWLPRYTGLVPVHDKYIGGHQYYVESKDENSMYSHLYKQVSDLCIEQLSERKDDYKTSRAHSDNILDLSRSIIGYLMAAAIRSLQEEKKGQTYKSSCLIHVEINKKYHEWQEELITSIIEDVRESFLKSQNADIHLLNLQQDAYEDFRQSNIKAREAGLIKEEFPSWADVESRMRRILRYQDYSINVVNSSDPGRVRTMLDNRGQLKLTRTANFFIGGTILDRGITLDNMLCFFYGRDPKKFQMDTVIQHARMYGARDKEDMAVTRFFTTEKIYQVLEMMNTFDDILRDYLVKHKENVRTEDITSIVIGYDSRIKPSAQSKFRPANTRVIRAKQRILPIGFQTGSYDEIAGIVSKIDKLIMTAPGYKVDDYFLIDFELAAKIIQLINDTFIYSEEYANVDYRWDTNEMLTILDNLTYNTDGKLWCLQRTGRNSSRLRENGKYRDAPDDGRTDKPAEVAIDRPALLLFRENGSQSQGWRNAPFYWPLLFTPENTQDGIFTINADKRIRKPKPPIELEKVKYLPKEEVLNVTMELGPFMDIILGLQDVEHRIIKPTTQSLYLARDERGQLMLAPGIPADKEYSVYDVVNGQFPFALKPFKYIHFRCSRDNSGSKLLVSLQRNKPYELVPEAYEDTDIVYNSSGKGHEMSYGNRAQWFVFYNIDEVLEYKMTDKDAERFKEYQEELDAADAEQE